MKHLFIFLVAFLINHSTHYHAAHLAGLTEFLIEAYFFPSWKQFGIINWLGKLPHFMITCTMEKQSV